MGRDILMGRQDVVCECPRGLFFPWNSYLCVWLSILNVEFDITFRTSDAHGGHSTETPTSLTIAVSVNGSSSLTEAVNIQNPIAADLDNPAAEGGAVHPTVQSNSDSETTQPLAVAAPPSSFSRTDDLHIESGTPTRPVADSQTETSRTALRGAEDAINGINTTKTWKGAVNVIKWVMDTVSPIAAVCQRFAYPLLS